MLRAPTNDVKALIPLRFLNNHSSRPVVPGGKIAHYFRSDDTRSRERDLVVQRVGPGRLGALPPGRYPPRCCTTV